MYARGEKFDLVKEVGGTTEASVHCVASLLKVHLWHVECMRIHAHRKIAEKVIELLFPHSFFSEN